ncbi:MAG: mannose-1-phosphate guanylyltransferase [Anaerolineae bacterium]|nr:MAG: mannose-1-phosphate guanylyltransferase [Anaerolineae bacterium]
MFENYFAVIMAGGGGTRLWPLSRRGRPKQMLALVGDKTLMQLSVDRLAGLFPPERIFVSTTADQVEELQRQCPELPHENFILEPYGRNNAPAVGLAALALRRRHPQAVMAMLTSDHYIENESLFLETLRAAHQAAEEGFLVTLGITPTHPATGFGYIEQGADLGARGGLPVFEARSFKEKPDAETARRFVTDRDHVWNSGMFIWQVECLLAEIQTQMPGLHAQLQAIDAAWGSTDALKAAWDAIPAPEATSIDFGIMEGAGKVAVIPASDLGWNDVGSWNALFDVIQPDAAGNVVHANDHIDIGSRNSLVIANGSSNRTVVTIGVSDLVIVDTGDVLLVCHRDQAQDVRKVVELLKQAERNQLL